MRQNSIKTGLKIYSICRSVFGLALFTVLNALSLSVAHGQEYDLKVEQLAPVNNATIYNGKPFEVTIKFINVGSTAIPANTPIRLKCYIDADTIVGLSAEAFGLPSELKPDSSYSLTVNYTLQNFTINYSNKQFCQKATVIGFTDPNLNNNYQCANVNLRVTPNSIEQVSIGNKIELYPNPARDNITFSCSFAINARIALYDMAGRMVASHFVNGTKATLETKGLSDGMYIYNVVDRDGAVLDKGKITIAH